MRISHKYKVVFLSNPRCGSTSVRKMLNTYCDVFSQDTGPFYHHTTASDLKKTFEQQGWSWEEYYKFCVTRNPWDRMYSAYKFGQISPKSVWHRIGSEVKDFEGFIKHPETFSQALRDLDYFTKNDEGELLVDKILRLEELNETLPLLLKECGVPVEHVLHVNSSDTRLPFWIKRIFEKVKPKKVDSFDSERDTDDAWSPIASKVAEEYTAETAEIVAGQFETDIRFGNYTL